MPKAFSRDFNAARKAQGFRSQAHLDAFYRLYDHMQACAVCSRVAGSVALHDGQQPVMAQCDEAKSLWKVFRATR